MNVHQTIPRSDCVCFAKCGKRSLAYCRRYGALECTSCGLVKRKSKNHVFEDGVEKKLCTHCGRVLPLHRFYDRRVCRGNREYHFKTSWCRQCMSAKVLERVKLQGQLYAEGK